jgi:hypothetical protein
MNTSQRRSQREVRIALDDQGPTTVESLEPMVSSIRTLI